MNVRRTAVVGLALVAVAASPAFAGAKKLAPAKPLVVTDKAGDANGINGQSHIGQAADPAADVDPSQSGPGQRSAADLLAVSLGRQDDGKTVTGLTATFTLGAAPDQGTIYRLQASTPDCSTFWVAYSVPVGGAPTATLRENCSGTAVVTPVTAVIKDSTITVSLPFSAMPKTIKLGTVFSGLFAETKGHASTPAASPTIPTIDDTAISAGTYKLGD